LWADPALASCLAARPAPGLPAGYAHVKLQKYVFWISVLSIDTGLRGIRMTLSLPHDIYQLPMRSLLLASLYLHYSSCRAVGHVPRHSVGILNWGSSMFSITGAPRNFISIALHVLSLLPGAALKHHSCTTHRHAPVRRLISSALGSGAAASDAVSRMARGRDHWVSPCPLRVSQSFATFPLLTGTKQHPGAGS